MPSDGKIHRCSICGVRVQSHRWGVYSETCRKHKCIEKYNEQKVCYAYTDEEEDTYYRLSEMADKLLKEYRSQYFKTNKKRIDEWLEKVLFLLKELSENV